MTRIVPLAQIHNGGWGEAQGVASALIGIRIVHQIPQLLQWNHQKKFNLEALKNTWREEDHFLDPFCWWFHLQISPQVKITKFLTESCVEASWKPTWDLDDLGHFQLIKCGCGLKMVKHGQTCSQCGFQVGESQHKPSHFGWLQY